MGNSGMTQYVWEPNNVLSQNLTVFQSGTYILMTSDSMGCQAYDSITITVTPAYYPPFLQVSPDSVFCVGGTVTLNVNADSLSTIQWLAPLSGNGFTQVVDTAGTYICSVTYCNITTTDSITVTQLIPVAHITITGSNPFCGGDSILLSGNANATTYAWLPDSSSSQTITVYNPGIYWLTITDYLGCSATDSVVIDTIPNNAPVSPDTAICTGTSITLYASGNQQIYWYSTSSATVPLDSGYSYTTPMLTSQVTYYIQSITAQCASLRDSVVVDVNNCQFDGPNCFSPNNDGYNDFFRLKADGYKNYHLIIFNRYGQKLFESQESGYYWDGYDLGGMQVPEGTYYYIFTALDYNNNPFSYKGFVTLIR
jgi:gliding motility-associated-like protein